MITNICMYKKEKCNHRARKEHKSRKRENGASLHSSVLTFPQLLTFLRPARAVSFVAAILLLVFSFAACPVETPEEDGFTVKLPIYGRLNGDGLPDGTWDIVYLSLTTGERVTDPAAIASAAWDVALEAHDASFFVLTNSGISADRAGSGGNGAVWPTEQFEFDRTGFGDRLTENLGALTDYTTDQKRYAMVMSSPAEEYLNVMTWLGYPGSDKPESSGLTMETHFKRKEPDQTGMASYVPYLFNQKQFYTMRGMPPNYTPTYRVYIVRHGNGVDYSKVQVNEVYLEYNSKKMAESVFVLKIRHERLYPGAQ